MKCLNCEADMTNYLVRAFLAQISYDVCEACGGFWLDAGELDKMAVDVTGSIEYSSRETTGETSEVAKPCPRCEAVTMEKVVFLGHSDLLLDRCGNCGGFWLDGGELELVNRKLTEKMPVGRGGFSRFIGDVHLPFWVKRIRRKSGETDFTIDVPPIAGAKFESESEHMCPVCDSNLDVFRVFGIEIDGCGKCKGIWLDRDELRILKDKSEQGTWGTLRWLDDEVEAIETVKALPSNLHCPKCHDALLVSTGFGESEIIIDWCPSCGGTWLDQHEYQAIIDHLKAQLDGYSSEEMAQKVYTEIKEIWDGPEGGISEILDAKAAISALLSIKIYEHPKLAKTLFDIQAAARTMFG